MKKTAALVFVCFTLGCSRSKPTKSNATAARPPVPVVPHSPTSTRPEWVQYSNMYIVEEEGDFLGTDLRLAKTENGYKMILFCGEGVPEGPVRASFEVHDQGATIHPSNPVCGQTMEIKIEPNALRMKVEEGDWELIPRHKNFIREERWK